MNIINRIKLNNGLIAVDEGRELGAAPTGGKDILGGELTLKCLLRES